MWQGCLASTSKSSPQLSISLHLIRSKIPTLQVFLFFTDGSNEDNKVALAVIQCKSHSEKLPYNTSIYIAELRAIKLALQYMKNIILL